MMEKVWACLLSLGFALPAAASSETPTALTGVLGDYDAELRGADGRVDVDRLTARLQELGVNTYLWLIWHAPTDWDDLQRFLPKAAAAKIDVWAYLVPPSESIPKTTLSSEPFRTDYHRWAEEIARLSLQHPNLKAWVIDDFYANASILSPAYMGEARARARRINPRLRFLPLMYFHEITQRFVDDYGDVVDGVVVAYPRDREEIAFAREVLNGEAAAFPGTLEFPWGTPSRAGEFVQAEQDAAVLPTGPYEVRFEERDDFTGPTSGYHFKQLLIDGNVAWEADVAGGDASWRAVTVDVTPWVAGKPRVTLAFRLYEKRGVAHFGIRWQLRKLVASGLQPAANLDQPQQWRVRQEGRFSAGFGPAPARRARPAQPIPFIVMTAGDLGEFRHRHGDPATPPRVAQWLEMCLEAWRQKACDGVVLYCLDKRPASETFPLARQLFHRFAP
ncbi:MAG: hypothetical protein QHJ73_00140 [Armatimonadota bacterium]|nr:hypothetical protein [Armatimonadota bacterium]